MAFISFNPNPRGRATTDCTVRAISKVTHQDWDTVYIGLAILGFEQKTMPDNNTLWTLYLIEKGFERFSIPNFCPNCYTVQEFCRDHPTGEFLLATGTHVVAVVNGDYYDTWNSGEEVPISYWAKRKE